MPESSETFEATLTLQEVADRLGVHYMTIYRYVRLGRLPARKVRGSWLVDHRDLEALDAPPEAPSRRGEAPWADRLESRMVAGDVGGAWAVVEAALASGSTPDGIYSDLLSPALASIGDRWTAGELGIDEEHLASAVAGRVIGRMSSRFTRPGRRKGTVVAAMPSGERHGFGLAMLADVLRGAGYSVLDLGPDTPTPSIVSAMGGAPDLMAVCLSVVYDDALVGLLEAIEGIRSEFDMVPVVVGGRAIRSMDHAAEMGADAWSAQLTGAAGLVATLADIGGTPPVGTPQ